MTDKPGDSVIDRLLQALAAQVATSPSSALAPAAVKALTGLSRDEASMIFGYAGHLVHFAADTESLELLIRLIAEAQRGEAAADATIMPGDRVRLAGDLPPSLAEYDANWLRQTVFVVRYVGDDATVDVQPDLTEDYVIETVPAAIGSPWCKQVAPEVPGLPTSARSGVARQLAEDCRTSVGGGQVR